MSLIETAISILIGLASLTYAFTAKQFYAAKGRFTRGRPLPKWIGRLLFLVVGVCFLFGGIATLFRKW